MTRYLIIADVLLFFASFFFPVFLFAAHEPVMGYVVFLWGWWGFIMFHFGWVANLLWIPSVILLLKQKIQLTRIMMICAALLALESFAVREWWFNEGSGTEVIGFGLGFYLWLNAILFLLVLSFIQKKPSAQVQ